MKNKTGLMAGVFDMFHIGHLNILKKAKENCDYLIVYVNSDNYTKEYKKKFPIINEKERIEIIKSIKYVDEVIIRNGESEIDLIQKTNANIFFSGDDWKGSERHKKLIEELNKINVEIMYFPYTQGISSTMIKEKILNDK